MVILGCFSLFFSFYNRLIYEDAFISSFFVHDSYIFSQIQLQEQYVNLFDFGQ